MVATDAGGFPPTIVTTWVTLVELETMVRIPPHVEDGHTEWTFPWMRKREGGEREKRGRRKEGGRKFRRVQAMWLSSHLSIWDHLQ